MSRFIRGQGASFRNDFNRNIVNQQNGGQDKDYENGNNDYLHGLSRNLQEPVYNVRTNEDVNHLKRRKVSSSDDSQRYYKQPNTNANAPSVSNSTYVACPRPDVNGNQVTGCKRARSMMEDDVVFLSRDQIERMSPSRKDGIDSVRETFLRYSYCMYLQNLGTQVKVPQTTIGTAMVLCHRFFVRRSHACHDRYLIATAALFLSAKSEETPRPLNNVLKASYDIFFKQDPNNYYCPHPANWFGHYRERVIEAENLILRTLNFELNVQHPYVPLTSVLNKLGLSEAVLLDLALTLVSEGLRSSLWLQFKPHHIAAGAAFLAARFLNFDLEAYQTVWQEFQTTPSIVEDVVQQLVELF